MPTMWSVDSSLNSSILVSQDTRSELESSPIQRNIYRGNQTSQFVTKESQDSVWKPSEPSFDTRFDWIENEMAKVCGEVGNYQEEFMSPSFTSSCLTEEFKTIPQHHDSEEKQTVVADASNPSCEPGKIDWKSLRRKHEAEFKQKLQKLEEKGDPKLKARLEKRFLELFGADESTEDALNGKKKDEIAALTVKHLMPFYKKQRIASKDLFKKLAKHISQSIIEERIFPDGKYVQGQVEEFFRGGKVVTSDLDIFS